MASFTVQYAKHASLTAATEDRVTLNWQMRYLQIVHRGSTTNPIYVKVGKSPSAATVTGDDTFVVTAGAPLTLPWPIDAGGACVVSLISAGAEPYSVQVVGDRQF